MNIEIHHNADLNGEIYSEGPQTRSKFTDMYNLYFNGPRRPNSGE